MSSTNAHPELHLLTTIHKDLDKVADWVATLSFEGSIHQWRFHLKHVLRKLHQVEEAEIEHVKQEIEKMIKELEYEYHDFAMRLKLAERIVVLRHQIPVSE